MYFMVQKVSKSIADKQGNTIRTETVTEGKSGKNLTLTIDMELQKSREHRKNIKGI